MRPPGIRVIGASCGRGAYKYYVLCQSLHSGLRDPLPPADRSADPPHEEEAGTGARTVQTVKFKEKRPSADPHGFLDY